MSMVPREESVRPLVYEHSGLSGMLSIGAPPAKGKNYPQKLGFFRAKSGRDGQWSAFSRAFNEHYHVTLGKDGEALDGPRALPVQLLSNDVGQVLDARLLAFGQDRLAARGDTNYSVQPLEYGKPEMVTAYPLESPPVRFEISGPNDPLCLGGSYDIPRVAGGKPSIELVTTLYVSLAEVGSFLAPVAISTKSVKSRSRLLTNLLVVKAATGVLVPWLFLLVVKPDRVSYRDDAGKRHSARAFTLDLVGPIRSLAEPKPLTRDDMRGEMDRLHEQGLLTIGQPSVTLGQPRDVPLLPPQLEAPEDPEVVDGEWVDDTDGSQA